MQMVRVAGRLAEEPGSPAPAVNKAAAETARPMMRLRMG
jgi:hypothetical protein